MKKGLAVTLLIGTGLLAFIVSTQFTVLVTDVAGAKRTLLVKGQGTGINFIDSPRAICKRQLPESVGGTFGGLGLGMCQVGVVNAIANDIWLRLPFSETLHDWTLRRAR